VCVPVLERESRLRWKEDFFVGYSPERINPGDKEHTLTRILKIVAGDTPETLSQVAAVYERIIRPGVHRASSIKTAEAAKVIENTQRDLNIALINEFAMIFNRLGIDTLEVLQAAGTKWNFLPFRPGLVGGHCIGVDPYYLTHKAQELGYHPEVILAGRRINDGMGAYVADRALRLMLRKQINPVGARVLVLGLAFKENCPDVRNSKVADLVKELEQWGATVVVADPWADAAEVQHEYGITLTEWEALPAAEALVVAVAHRSFQQLPLPTLATKLRAGGVFVDVKAAFDAAALRALGLQVWRL
jgi:UDP-N-acetyl-D-galactosamine dehydrogenase